MTSKTITTARGASLTLTASETGIVLSGAFAGRVDQIEIPYSGQSKVWFVTTDGRKGLAVIDGQKDNLRAVNTARTEMVRAKVDRERREFNASSAGRSYALTKKMNREFSDY